MKWEAWVIVSVLAVGQMLNVLLVGAQRKPLTPGQAVGGLIGAGFLAVLAVRLGT